MLEEDHWLVGLPAGASVEKSIAEVTGLVRRFTKHRLNEFFIPRLKKGTLDDLMFATDKLLRLYEKTKDILAKLINVAEKVFNKKRTEVAQELSSNGRLTIDYLTNFEWEIAKYPIHQSISDIADLLDKRITQTSVDMIKMSRDYFEIDEEIRLLERQQDCSLHQRDVSFFVEEEDFVLDSKYLTTALVVVQRTRYTEWMNCYERIDREVVPRSSRLLLEDEDHGIFTVTLFKRHLDLFAKRAKELRFHVRDFVYQPKEVDRKRLHFFMARLSRTKLLGPLVKWLKAHFVETYIALLHLQALRLQVECDLRYGPHTTVFAYVITVPSMDSGRLLQVLRKHYQHIDESLKYICDRYKLHDTDDFPFVSFQISSDTELFN